MLVQFAQEKIADVLPELEPLLMRNFQETGAFDEADFSPDYDRYVVLEESGMAKLFTVRKFDALVGYSIFMVINHLHFKQMYWAMQDVLWIEPDLRGPCAVRFLRWTDEQLKELGVEVIYRHVNRNVDFSRTLIRMGYEDVERSFVRRFRNGS